jgi:alkanesulfonate monooxygenase SsuD/methylene tetrahydromethanopterin reductase-like flavin-dependent oxidoreductase (luciferase family)
MEYGIHFTAGMLNGKESPIDYITTVARTVDKLGYSWYASGEHLERGLDLQAALTVAATASGRLKLITSIHLAVPRGLLATTKWYMTMDVLSGGRMYAGVSAGSAHRDYDLVGLEHEDMWSRFDESIRAMRAYMTPGHKPFKGKYYSTEGFNLEPAPLQKPGVPIWIGSWGSDAGLRRVARLADGWLGSAGPGHQSPEQFATDKQRLDTFLKERGKDPATFPNAVSTMAMFVSDEKEELERVAAPQQPGNPLQQGGRVTRPAERPFEDEHAHDMIGSRAECIDKVRRWQAAGAQALFLGPRGPDPLGQMRTFIEDVASKV